MANAKKAAPKKAAVTLSDKGPGINTAEVIPGDNPKQLARTSKGKRPAPITGTAGSTGTLPGALGVGDDRAVTTTLEEATKVGLLGREVDGTPNENYTLRGVGKGLPTPETQRGA